MIKRAGWLRHRVVAVLLLLLTIGLAGCAAATAAPISPPATPPHAPQRVSPAASVEAIFAASAQTSVVAQARRATTQTARPTSTTVPTAAAVAQAQAGSPTVIPTPSPRPAGTPPRVGIQAGHLKSNELPEELARLRTSTGARWGGVTEAELNYDIAVRVKALLEAQGVVVDLLPATIPVRYDADAFVAIHADGSQSPAARGWKLATPWRTSRASSQLLNAVDAAYGATVGLPRDAGGVTMNMRGYYAFNYRRHEHAIARTTPGIIVEMGFMTNASDRAVLFDQPDRVARGIADGVMAYLNQRDPNDGAALLPPEFPSLRTGPEGAVVRAAPDANAKVRARVDADARLFPISREGEWYQVFVRGQANIQGWIHQSQVVETNEQPVFPTATNP